MSGRPRVFFSDQWKNRARASLSPHPRKSERERKGETLMAEVLEVTRQNLVAGSDTKIIKDTGKETFSRGKLCVWYTAGGASKSNVTITNKDSKNTLSLAITGAPDAVTETSSKQPLNGQWEIPKKGRIMAYADFEGRTVSFFNNSAKSVDCEIMAQTRN
jgi:hypothetical protein